MSALFGIGGGSLTVPYLSWNSVPMRQRRGSLRRLQHAHRPGGQPQLPLRRLGAIRICPSGPQFIYLPALRHRAPTSAQFARFGARLAHRLSPARLKQAFALLMLLVGAKFMLFS